MTNVEIIETETPTKERGESEAGSQTQASRASQGGFTLLEIMIVLAIIGLIVGGVAVNLFGRFKKAQAETTKTNIAQIASASEQYMIENTNACPQSIEDLVSKGYLKKKVQDSWGRDFVIKCPGANDGVDISSGGPDKQDGTADDIKSW